MFKLLVKWYTENRKWHQEHKQSWNGMDVGNNGNLSCFQELCESRLLAELEKINVKIRNREVCGSDEIYITGLLGNTELRYYIYNDGAEIDDISFEKWDYINPDELCDAFVSAVVARVIPMREKSKI